MCNVKWGVERSENVESAWREKMGCFPNLDWEVREALSKLMSEG